MKYSDDFTNLIQKYNDELRKMKSKSKPMDEGDVLLTQTQPQPTSPPLSNPQQTSPQSTPQQSITQQPTAPPLSNPPLSTPQQSTPQQSTPQQPIPQEQTAQPPLTQTPEMQQETQIANEFPFTNTFELPSISPDQAIEGETENLSGTGFLVVRVFTAKQAVPVEDATVIVSQTDKMGEKLIKSAQTNSSGEIEKLSLPTVAAAQTLKPGVRNPYAAYKIRVVSEGYFTIDDLNVPIFDNQTAVLPVEMIPLPENYGGDETLSAIQTGPIGLQ